MALTIIDRNSAASVLITFAGGSQKSYNAQFRSFDVDSSSGEIDQTTFASETNGEYGQTAVRTSITYAGITKTGIDGGNGEAVHAKLSANPKDVPMTFQFASSASVAATVNVYRHVISRVAGAVSTFAGSVTATGSVVWTWTIT